MLLLLHLGCATNQGNTELGYLLQLLVQVRPGPRLGFLESSLLKKLIE